MIKLNELLLDPQASNHQLILDQINWRINSLHTNIKHTNKLNFYKRVLKRSTEDLNISSPHFFQDYQIDYQQTNKRVSDNYNRKQIVLIELINTIEHLLIDEENIYYLDKFQKLESEVSAYLDIQDLILKSIQYYEISENTSLLKTLRNWRRYILQKHFKKIFRDLRLSFRCILKTLFKNLDDEDSKNKVLKINYLETLFMNFNNHDEKTRNAFAFKKYTTYKC